MLKPSSWGYTTYEEVPGLRRKQSRVYHDSYRCSHCANYVAVEAGLKVVPLGQKDEAPFCRLCQKYLCIPCAIKKPKPGRRSNCTPFEARLEAEARKIAFHDALK